MEDWFSYKYYNHMHYSVFSIVVVLETRVPKQNLSLGFIDEQNTIGNDVLRQLQGKFPEELYSHSESLDSYVFSLKENIPVKQLVDIQKGVLSLMDFRHSSTRFDWVTFPYRMELDSNQNGFLRRGLKVEQSGIQIYLSNDKIQTEISGELKMITHPLREHLKDTLSTSDYLIDAAIVRINDINY